MCSGCLSITLLQTVNGLMSPTTGSHASFSLFCFFSFFLFLPFNLGNFLVIFPAILGNNYTPQAQVFSFFLHIFKRMKYIMSSASNRDIKHNLSDTCVHVVKNPRQNTDRHTRATRACETAFFFFHIADDCVIADCRFIAYILRAYCFFSATACLCAFRAFRASQSGIAVSGLVCVTCVAAASSQTITNRTRKEETGNGRCQRISYHQLPRKTSASHLFHSSCLRGCCARRAIRLFIQWRLDTGKPCSSCLLFLPLHFFLSFSVSSSSSSSSSSSFNAVSAILCRLLLYPSSILSSPGLSHLAYPVCLLWFVPSDLSSLVPSTFCAPACSASIPTILDPALLPSSLD